MASSESKRGDSSRQLAAGSKRSSTVGRPDPNVNLESAATCMEKTTMSYINPIMRTATAHSLDLGDLGAPSPQDKASRVYEVFRSHYEAAAAGLSQKQQEKMGLLGVCLSVAGMGTVLTTALLNVAIIALSVARPMIVKNLLEELLDPTTPAGDKWFAACLLLALPTVSAFVNAMQRRTLTRSGIHIKTALTTAIYRKALKVQLSMTGATTGEVVNLMSTDTTSAMYFVFSMHDVWVAPITVAVGIYLLNDIVGPACFVGLAVLVGLAPVNGCVMSKLYKVYFGKMKIMDERVKVINEVIQGIRIIKFYAWEQPFQAAVNKIRKSELKLLLKLLQLIAVGFQLLLGSSVILMNLLVFVVFVGGGGVLDTPTAFTTLMLFDVIRGPFMQLPQLLVQFLTTKVALGRIAKYLATPELPGAAEAGRTDGRGEHAGEAAVDVSDAVFRWSKPEVPPENPKVAAAKAKQVAAKRANIEKAKKAGGKKAAAAAELETKMDAALEAERVAKEAAAAPPFELAVGRLKVRRGELLAIVGKVGSGKTTLLSGILGEMERVKGSVGVHGSVAYAQQQPWIMNATVKDNITFGHPVRATWYKEVVRMCALESDFKIMPGGDKCEIGEKGINLSGGQKARVALARAVYANGDIFIADDPLSAVDSHVGEHLFNECLVKGLGSCTRILVTNQLQFLPKCDRVVVIDGGKVSDVGTYHELLTKGGSFAALMADIGVTESEDDKAVGGDGEAKDAADGGAARLARASSDGKRRRVSSARSRTRSRAHTRQKSSDSTAEVDAMVARERSASRSASAASMSSAVVAAASAERERTKSVAAHQEGKLMDEEGAAEGLVDPGVYSWYFANASGWGLFLSLFSLLLTQVGTLGHSFWLGHWSARDMVVEGHETFLWGFALIAVGTVLALFSTSMAQARVAYQASENIHDLLMQSVLAAPIAFFDVTPAGRVINRFSKDVDDVDNVLGRVLGYAAMSIAALFGAVAGILVSTKGTFVVVLVPVALLYLSLMRFIRRASVEIQRIDSTTRSPVFTSFSETLGGLGTIRAYARQAHFVEDNDKKQDINNHAALMVQAMSIWVSIRLELLGAVVIFSIAALAVAAPDFVDVGFIAVGLSLGVNMTQMLQGVVEMVAVTEAKMNSVERIKEYTQDIEKEAPALIPGPEGTPPPEWPQAGAIEFDDLKMRYRDGPLVLHGVTASIKSKEKIGVVGRTGAGKSSLMVALFRIVELAGGSVIIDGVNISKIGLRSLRSKLGIIPQDPVLFSGTVRYNLDPFEDHEDAALWDALELAQLKDEIPSLDKEVTEGGDNFSVGQRQLICMARALLRKPKILIMDEATANVDVHTDAKIQHMIRSAFVDSTVLTIAHRLETIMDSTRVMVLDKGRLAELDTPLALLNKPKGDPASIFRGMVEVTGDKSTERLRAIASGELEVAAFIREGGSKALADEGNAAGSGRAAGGPTPYDLDMEEIPVLLEPGSVKSATGSLGLTLARTADELGAVVAVVGGAAPAAIASAGVLAGDALLSVDGAPVDSLEFDQVQALVDKVAKQVSGEGKPALVMFGRPIPGTGSAAPQEAPVTLSDVLADVDADDV